MDNVSSLALVGVVLSVLGVLCFKLWKADEKEMGRKDDLGDNW